MNWQDSLAFIESPELDADLNLASGTSSFFRRVGKEPVILETLRMMGESGEVCEEVLGRICDLSLQESDPNFENPNDTPLAVLLWLTYFTAPNFARAGAYFIERAPRCWYARRLAEAIINPMTPVSSYIWENFGTQGNIFHGSPSAADSLNTVSPGNRFPMVTIPWIDVPGDATHETYRQASQWGMPTMELGPANMLSTTGSSVVDGESDLVTERWYSSHAAGGRP